VKSRRWVSWLLGLFPQDFREGHRAEIEEHVEEAFASSTRPRALTALVVSLDLARAALRLRLRPARGTGSARDRRAGPLLAGSLTDLRVVCRGLARRPGFAAVVVVTLALGVGLNTALFSVVNEAILKPLEYEDPDRLVYLTASLTAQDIDNAQFSGGDLVDLREVSALVAVEGMATIRQNLNGAGLPRQVRVGWVSNGFLDMLGVEAEIGRVHGPDDPPGSVVLSHELWQSAFGGSGDALGRSVELDGYPYSVIGVMPAGFQARLPRDEGASPRIEIWKNPDTFWQNGDVWHAQGPEFALIEIVARLRADAGVADAQAGVDRVVRDLRARYPSFEEDGYAIAVDGLHDLVVRGTRPVLLMLLAAVGAVLLIACANVANLLLVRGHARRREIALRVALGSSRRRIGRFLMLESLVLALAGTIAGLLLATGTIALVPRLAPPGFAAGVEARLDGVVFAFALVTGVLVTVLVGLLPTLVALRGDPGTEMAGGRVVGFGGASFRRGLVVAQLALSLVLLIGAGLLVSSMARLQRIDPGFDPTDVYTFGVSIPGTQYGFPEEAGAFYRAVEARIADLPGVESVGVVWPMPFSTGWSGGYGTAEGEPQDLGQVPYRLATEAYFSTMRVPLTEGRLFRDGDPRPVVVISEAAAERAWPGQPPIGRTLSANPWGGGPVDFEVIGVVGDVRYDDLREPSEGTLYFDARSWSWVDWEVHVLVRTETPAGALLPSLREAVASVDPAVPVAHPAPLEDGFRAETADSRFVLSLLGAFAATAGLLALVGLYGVVAYAVGMRRREFGVRIALGAAASGIRRIVMLEGALVVTAGLGLGLLGAWAGSAVLESLLFEVSAKDPFIYMAVALLLAAGAGAASWIPAWRVGRVDPVEVLRAD
jgi:putative ABC transport system permease protein